MCIRRRQSTTFRRSGLPAAIRFDPIQPGAINQMRELRVCRGKLILVLKPRQPFPNRVAVHVAQTSLEVLTIADKMVVIRHLPQCALQAKRIVNPASGVAFESAHDVRQRRSRPGGRSYHNGFLGIGCVGAGSRPRFCWLQDERHVKMVGHDDKTHQSNLSLVLEPTQAINDNLRGDRLRQDWTTIRDCRCDEITMVRNGCPSPAQGGLMWRLVHLSSRSPLDAGRGREAAPTDAAYRIT